MIPMKTCVRESQKQKIKKECHQLWVEYGLLPGRLEDRVYQRINSKLPVPTSFVPDAYIDNCIGFVRDECKTYSELRKIDSRVAFVKKSSLGKPMDPELFSAKMLTISDMAETEDEEVAHMNADALLVEVLRAYGYDRGCDVFENMPKWYA